jgi:hypothetical protein
LRQSLAEVEDAHLVGAPAVALPPARERPVELDQAAVVVGIGPVALQHEHVTVAVGAPAALDSRVTRHGLGAAVALVPVRADSHGHPSPSGPDHLERDSVARVRAEVGVQVVAAVGEDPGDHGI